MTADTDLKAIYDMCLPVIDAAVAEAVTAEREACAQLADAASSRYDDEIGRVDIPLSRLADAIRSRGGT